MFTGIVTTQATVRSFAPRSGGARLELSDHGFSAEDQLELGESICVSGACLTICATPGPILSFDISAETMRKTTLGHLRAGHRVNLERALAVGDRLGGHIVSGHVDGIGRMTARRPDGNAERFEFALPADGTVRVIEKGSIAIDGISLTTWDCRGGRFSVAVIPHTLEVTTLGQRRVGDQVNLEQDQIGRWVAAMAAPYHG